MNDNRFSVTSFEAIGVLPAINGPNLNIATENKFSSAVSTKQNNAIKQFSAQDFFLHYAQEPLLTQNRPFPILQKENTTSEVILQELFRFEMGKYYLRKKPLSRRTNAYFVLQHQIVNILRLIRRDK